MTANQLAAALETGRRFRLTIDMGRGCIERPVVTRATVQRFGAIDLVTFHESGAPDHVGAFSTKGECEVVGCVEVAA